MLPTLKSRAPSSHDNRKRVALHTLSACLPIHSLCDKTSSCDFHLSSQPNQTVASSILLTHFALQSTLSISYYQTTIIPIALTITYKLLLLDTMAEKSSSNPSCPFLNPFCKPPTDLCTDCALNQIIIPPASPRPKPISEPVIPSENQNSPRQDPSQTIPQRQGPSRLPNGRAPPFPPGLDPNQRRPPPSAPQPSTPPSNVPLSSVPQHPHWSYMPEGGFANQLRIMQRSHVYRVSSGSLAYQTPVGIPHGFWVQRLKHARAYLQWERPDVQLRGPWGRPPGNSSDGKNAGSEEQIDPDDEDERWDGRSDSSVADDEDLLMQDCSSDEGVDEKDSPETEEDNLETDGGGQGREVESGIATGMEVDPAVVAQTTMAVMDAGKDGLEEEEEEL
ncbi:hypothetical protein BT63DRAFT_281615 [Microthyrium microscopicum]|uniref:Uncharacterized protein n=1 Tax=Microthyrium microscopicum TaxID=703497 RepID=A0A6A6U8W9_9PEZI|nr:hypothetical protein BT63DRAFT_281615 [Microthyrium microscopicum]